MGQSKSKSPSKYKYSAGHNDNEGPMGVSQNPLEMNKGSADLIQKQKRNALIFTFIHLALSGIIIGVGRNHLEVFAVGIISGSMALMGFVGSFLKSRILLIPYYLSLIIIFLLFWAGGSALSTYSVICSEQKNQYAEACCGSEEDRNTTYKDYKKTKYGEPCLYLEYEAEVIASCVIAFLLALTLIVPFWYTYHLSLEIGKGRKFILLFRQLLTMLL